MSNKIQISEAESQVMAALWKKAPLTPEQIIAAVGPANGWAAGTVRTLITRLLRKKALVGSRGPGGPGDSRRKRRLRPMKAR